jgi:hypothetical protein
LEDMRHVLEDSRLDLETQLADVEAWKRRAGDGNVRANVNNVKPPKFDGSTSWTVFHRQFESAAIHNHWTPKEKGAYLLSVLQGKAADILHNVPAEASYEDIVGSLPDRFRNHQQVATYRSQLKARDQMSCETLQDFAAAVDQ